MSSFDEYVNERMKEPEFAKGFKKSVKNIEEFKRDCPHEYTAWEYDETRKLYTKRCPRCGTIVETIERYESGEDVES